MLIPYLFRSISNFSIVLPVKTSLDLSSCFRLFYLQSPSASVNNKKKESSIPIFSILISYFLFISINRRLGVYQHILFILE